MLLLYRAVASPILLALLNRKSYKNIIARGAVEGLKIISLETSKKEIIDTIEKILIEKSKRGNDDRIRQTAASALGYIARYYKDRIGIVTHLKGLLNDGSIHIRNTAYASLGNVFQYMQDIQMAQDLKQALLNEASDFVRQTANRSINLIQKSPAPTHQLASGIPSLKDANYKIKTIEDMEKRIVLY